MNGKMILLVFLCINLVAFSFSIGCINDAELTCEKIGNDAMTKLFISGNSLLINDNIENAGGFSFSDNFTNASQSLTEQESGIVSSTLSGLSVFLDVVRIIFAMIVLLTPFPIMSFMFSLGFPIWVNLLITAPLSILYVLSVTEFVGARQL